MLHGVVGELATENLFDLGFVLLAERLQIVGRQVRVFGDALGFLHFVHHAFELVTNALAFLGLDAFGLLHDHVGVHGDQAAVGVVDKSLAAGLLDEAGDGGRAEADIEDRFHHAGHRLAGTGAAGDKKRILAVAVLHAHGFFGQLEGRFDLGLQAGGEVATLGEVVSAALGGDGEAGGDGQLEVAHFGQVRAFTAEKVALGSVAVRSGRTEAVDVFRCHEN